MSKLALIRGLDVRVSDEDLRKLDYVSRELGFNANRSKAIRYLVSEYAELFAWQAHQQEEVEKYKCT